MAPSSTDRDTEEFSQFMAARAHQLYRSAYLLTTSQQGAEDLLQTALAKTFAAWSRVRRADDPVAYVHGIVIKTFLSDRRRRSSTELPVAEPARATGSRIGADVDPTDRIALMTALAELSATDRAVVVLRFWEDRSVAQTAHDLSLTEAAVKNRSLRALRALRHLLDVSVDVPLTNGSPS